MSLFLGSCHILASCCCSYLNFCCCCVYKMLLYQQVRWSFFSPPFSFLPLFLKHAYTHNLLFVLLSLPLPLSVKANSADLQAAGNQSMLGNPQCFGIEWENKKVGTHKNHDEHDVKHSNRTQTQTNKKTNQIHPASLNQWKHTVSICVHLYTRLLRQTQAMFVAEHGIQELLQIPLPVADL